MAVRQIQLLGNPLLRTRCRSVKSFSDGDLDRTVRDLRDTLGDFRSRHGFGRGIAAPQIGVSTRIIVVGMDPSSRPLALINPEIIRRSRATMVLWDDCFSFPDLLVKVKRHLKVLVRFRDQQARLREVLAEGGLSELLQHEIDHTEGILALDRAIDSRHIVLRSEWKKFVDTGKNIRTL